MAKTLRKIHWFFKRHPFLYYARYILVSRKRDEHLLVTENYNRYNSLSSIPRIFHEQNLLLQLDDTSTLEKAKEISKHITDYIKPGPGVGASSEKAMQAIIEGKGGVCSDISQVFNNFCVLNGIKVREWGVIDRFYEGKYGHSFNEVYAPEMGKWIAIDPSRCILFYDEEDNVLAAVDIFDKTKKGEKLSFKEFNKLPYQTTDNTEQIYFNPDCIPFLIFNYKIKSQDWFYNNLSFFPNSLTSLLMILTNNYFKYMMLYNDHKKILSKKSEENEDHERSAQQSASN